MSDLNNWTGIGRLTRDAETKTTAGGMAICSFAIAVNRRVKRGDKWEEMASFFDIELFGKQAESVGKYLVKGKQVGITGELVQDRWEKDGQARSKIKIVADNVYLLGSNAAGQTREDRSPAQPARYDPPIDDGDFQDDIPF